MRISCLLILVLAALVPAQVLTRDIAHPSCWIFGGVPRSTVAQRETTWQQNGDRLIELTRLPGGHVGYVYLCGANPSSPLARSWTTDTNVTITAAEALAQSRGMMLASLAPEPDPSLGHLFVTLSEDCPPGIEWTVVPARTPSSIAAWLAARPGWQPYAVDSCEAWSGGLRSHFVLAMRSLPGGPVLRPRRIVFDASAASLPLRSSPTSEWVSDIDMTGLDRYSVVLSSRLPGEIGSYREVLVPDRPQDPCVQQAQLERMFGWTLYLDSSGQWHDTKLRVSNVWSIYEIPNYPACGPSAGYRGSVNSFGRTTLGVTSNQGQIEPGSRLSFLVSPVPFGAGALIAFGAQRTAEDLASIGAPGVLTLLRPEVLLPMSVAGTSATLELNVPPDLALRGFRFYAQAAVTDPAANAAGLATSQMFALTVF